LAAVLLSSGCNTRSDYGQKIERNGCAVFYKKPVQQQTAQKTLDFLIKDANFCKASRKSVQLIKAGEAYQFRMVVKPGTDKKEGVVHGIAVLAAKLSADVFGGAETVVHLCDNRFKTLRVVKAFAVPTAAPSTPKKQ